LDKENTFHSAFRKHKREKWQELTSLFDFEENPYPMAVDSEFKKAYLLAAAGPAKIKTMFEHGVSNQPN
jgi:hypothetical protein